MSDPSIDRYTMQASEEATRRNVTAVVDHGNETRRIARENQIKVERIANDLNALRERFDQQFQYALAGAMRRIHELEAANADLTDRIAALEAGDGDHD